MTIFFLRMFVALKYVPSKKAIHVVCSTPHTLSPAALITDTLSVAIRYHERFLSQFLTVRFPAQPCNHLTWTEHLQLKDPP